MILNCPKCGFAQPRDQYCASCGVDMLAFKPPVKPLWQRIAGNTLVQLVVVVTVVIGLYGYVKVHNRQQLAERIAEIENAQSAPITAKRADVAESQPGANVKSTEAASIEAASGEVVNVASNEATSTSSSFGSGSPDEPASDVEALASAPAGASSPASPVSAPKDVKLTILTIPRPYPTSLLGDPRNSRSVGVITYGVVTNIESRLSATKSTESWREVDSSEQSLPSGGQPARFFTGARAGEGQGYGFNVYVESGATDENGTQMKIVVQRHLYDAQAANQMEEIEIPLPADAVSIPRKGAFFIAGALPHRELASAEQRLYANAKLFRVYGREDFRNSTSDVLILIEPK